VRIVYSITNALEIARREGKREVVHFAIGFETTSPTTCAVLQDIPENFSLYCVHRLIPPTLDFLLSLGEAGIDGFIDPGHVSVIIGSDAYAPISEKYRIPQVITGFGGKDILEGIAMLLSQVREGRHEVENQYSRMVRPDGNPLAREMMAQTFEVVDAEWRALGFIPRSGYELQEKYAYADAKRKYEDLFEKFTFEERGEEGCRCGEVLRGLISSEECPLFGGVCTPESPVGPCMVGSEGTCAITHKYGLRK
jgi:hydrogenase expression/formation protein HypD